MWALKFSFLSKETPKNCTSSTTGTFWPSKHKNRIGVWSLCWLQKCAHTVLVFKIFKPLLFAQLYILLRLSWSCLNWIHTSAPTVKSLMVFILNEWFLCGILCQPLQLTVSSMIDVNWSVCWMKVHCSGERWRCRPVFAGMGTAETCVLVSIKKTCPEQVFNGKEAGIRCRQPYSCH